MQAQLDSGTLKQESKESLTTSVVASKVLLPHQYRLGYTLQLWEEGGREFVIFFLDLTPFGKW